MAQVKHAIVHVADIHYCSGAPEGASSVIKAFLDDLQMQVKSFPDYQFCIVITGDIVKAGANIESYELFIKEVDEQLTNMGLTKNFRIIVPGNHDLDRQLVEDHLTEYETIHHKHSKDETQFNDFMSKPNLIFDKFENYELFVSEFANYDDSFSRLGWGWNIDSDVGVYCLNSALCSFGGLNEIEDEGELAIYTRGLVEWCNNKTTTTNILLLHHPLDHLNDWSKTELQSIMQKHFCLCLYGHNHTLEVYHNRIPQNSLMCSAPPLFSNKQDTLAYSIVLIENSEPSKIVYREYSKGDFFPGARLSKTTDGIVKLESIYLHNLQQLEKERKNALQSFKGQPYIFIEPNLSKSREFNDEPNQLDSLIESPENTIIIAPPQFGLTCLALYMRIQAFKQKKLWIYIDAIHVKARNVLRTIEEQLHQYDKQTSDILCIMVDAWDRTIIDHSTMIKNIDAQYPDIPLILLSSKVTCFEPTYFLPKVDKELKVLHLQALTRHSMRQLVSSYNEVKHIGKEDEILSHMTRHMETINIHRTTLNCLTLLRILESSYNEKVLNRTKLIKAILFVLFTDSDSFSYSNENPEVGECTYVIGKYCKQLVLEATKSFNEREFIEELKAICKRELMPLDIDKMVQVLVDNNILIKYGNTFEFKHTFWIFYFAAECMLHDVEFFNYVMTKQKYVNFPEIIEFYAGIDGKREDAMHILLSDLNHLIDKVDNNIGIKGPFNPLSNFLWNPSDRYIEETRLEIAEKVESSNLPSEIKDKYADESYNSKAPYDQSINKFLDNYAVLSLLQSIKATSRALRNSTFIKAELKLEVSKAIFRGWEEISKVIFWLSPLLAKRGRAAHDGLSLVLARGFSENIKERFREILIANPSNVVALLKDDLASQKIGLIICQHLKENCSEMQKHLITLFLLAEHPYEWDKHLLDHLNLLHTSSFYLGNILENLCAQIKLGYIDSHTEVEMKKLVGAVLAKYRYASKKSEKRPKAIPPNMMLNEANKLPIDKLFSTTRKDLNKQLKKE